MTKTEEIAFHNLLTTWTRHQDLKSSGAPVAELYDSRIRLDEARMQARRGDLQLAV
jgi:hypothetical protein